MMTASFFCFVVNGFSRRGKNLVAAGKQEETRVAKGGMGYLWR